MNMRSIKFGVVIVIGSAVLLAISISVMSGRVTTYNDALPDPFVFKTQSSREFIAWGKKVTITDVRVTDESKQDHAAVEVHFGDSKVIIPVIEPKLERFKDLSAHEESLAVLSFAPIREGRAITEPFSDEHWRAVIVSRQTAEGWNEDTWGEVRVKDFTFLIYELLPDGTFASQAPRKMQFRDRRGRVPDEVYAREELKRAGKPVPPMSEQLTKVEPIEERTWEWQAALFTVPKGQVSRYRFKSDAVSAMGWTLPGAGVAMLGAIVGTFLIMLARTKPTAA